MNAMSKKLLSMLVVVAMVLSMVPFGGLSIFAVESNAATPTPEQIQEEAENLDFSRGYCPIHGEGVTWTEMSASNTVANGGHYYVGTTVTSTNTNWIATTSMTAGETGYICVHLNDKDITVGGRVLVNKAVTLNFMGSGSVTHTNMTSGSSYQGLFPLRNTTPTLNLYGGTYTSTWGAAPNTPDPKSPATNYYGTVSVTAGGTVNIYNGVTIEVAEDAAYAGSNIVVTDGTVNMYGGTIQGGKGYSYHGNTLGTAGTENVGGNVYLRTSDATFNMSGGTIQGGSAASGGNVYLYDSASLDMSGDATISGGTATANGGNIYAYTETKILMSGESSIEGGTSTSDAPNIRLRGAELVMSGDAKVVGGCKGTTWDANGSGVYPSNNAKVTLCGNATFEAAKDEDGEYRTQNRLIFHNPTTPSVLQIDNSWTGSANLYVYTKTYAKGDTIDSTVAQWGTYADGSFTVGSGDPSFTGTLYYHDAEANIVGAADGALKVASDVEIPDAVVGVFAPWDCGGMAYCQACIDLGTPVEDALVSWTVYNGQHGNTALSDPNVVSHYHFYLEKNLEYTTSYALTTEENICLNLNGYDIIPNTSAKQPTLRCNQRLNLFNTGAEATVWGNSLYATTRGGCVANLNGGKASATFNLFDNVILKSDATAADDSPILSIADNGGEINIYGGTIDARGLTVNGLPSAILVAGSKDSANGGDAIVNMYGGTIYGGTSTGDGGTIRVGSNRTEDDGRTHAGTAEFNMYGGTIDGGTANGTTGGGIFYIHGNTVNIYGGTVKNGSAPNGNGGNFNVATKTKTDGTVVPGILNISQKETDVSTLIEGGFAGKNGGSISLGTGCEMNMSDGIIRDGSAGTYAGNIHANGASILMTGNSRIEHGLTPAGNPNIWLNSAHLVMQDSATVVGGITQGNSTSPSGAGVSAAGTSTVTLCDNATFEYKVATTPQNRLVYFNGGKSVLQIDKSWTGFATFFDKAKENEYTGGDTITNGACGTYEPTGFTKDESGAGTFSGDLMYHLNSVQTKVYGVNGDLVLAQGAVVTENGMTWYPESQKAVDNYVEGSYVLLARKGDTVTIEDDIYIESRGNDLTVSGNGMVYALDSENDDYAGSGNWTLGEDVEIAEEAVNPVNGNRYISLLDGDTYSAHRVEVKLTHVTLRTSGEPGLYYKAEYKCDETLAGRVSSYGVALSVYGMPNADLEVSTEGGIVRCTALTTDFNPDKENHAVATTSGILTGIFKNTADRNSTSNAANGGKPVYANAYIKVDRMGTDMVTGDDQVVVGITDTENKQVAYSLYDALEAINDNWDTVIGNDVNKIAIMEAFYRTWSDEDLVDPSFWTGLDQIIALGNN